MTKYYICDDVPFVSFESARLFAAQYANATGQILAIEINDTLPGPGPAIYQSPVVKIIRKPTWRSQQLRHAARQTAIYLKKSRYCVKLPHSA